MNTHTVQTGDNLSTIARRYGVPVSSITGYRSGNPDLIYPGEVLQVGSPAPAQTPAPTAPSPSPTAPAGADVARSAAEAGLGVNDLQQLLTLPPEEQDKIRNGLAQQFGYGDFNAFTMDVLRKPTKSSEQIYKDAYEAAGLPALLEKINARKGDLTSAEGGINENPWLSEASRVGRLKRLQQLGGGEITNLIEEYKTKLEQVNGLVTRTGEDFAGDQRVNEARLKYLTDQVESETEKARTRKLAGVLPEYAKTKSGMNKPDTVTVDGSLYQWDPTRGEFVLSVAAKPKTPTTTSSERYRAAVAVAIKLARPVLDKSRKDGFIDGNEFLRLRSDYAQDMGDVGPFDDAFVPLLSPADRAKYGIGKTTNAPKAESPSGEPERDP